MQGRPKGGRGGGRASFVHLLHARRQLRVPTAKVRHDQLLGQPLQAARVGRQRARGGVMARGCGRQGRGRCRGRGAVAVRTCRRPGCHAMPSRPATEVGAYELCNPGRGGEAARSALGLAAGRMHACMHACTVAARQASLSAATPPPPSRTTPSATRSQRRSAALATPLSAAGSRRGTAGTGRAGAAGREGRTTEGRRAVPSGQGRQVSTERHGSCRHVHGMVVAMLRCKWAAVQMGCAPPHA